MLILQYLFPFGRLERSHYIEWFMPAYDIISLRKHHCRKISKDVAIIIKIFVWMLSQPSYSWLNKLKIAAAPTCLTPPPANLSVLQKTICAWDTKGLGPMHVNFWLFLYKLECYSDSCIVYNLNAYVTQKFCSALGCVKWTRKCRIRSLYLIDRSHRLRVDFEEMAEWEVLSYKLLNFSFRLNPVPGKRFPRQFSSLAPPLDDFTLP